MYNRRGWVGRTQVGKSTGEGEERNLRRAAHTASAGGWWEWRAQMKGGCNVACCRQAHRALRREKSVPLGRYL